jgi:HD-like signal output (HDOD) protein
MDIADHITDKLRAAVLPPLPELTQKIIRLTQDFYADPNDIADLVKMDLSLSTSVLKVANSVAFGYAGKVSSIGEAINRIGITRMRDMVLSVSLIHNFRTLRGIDFGQFWNHCLAVGLGAEIIERRATGKSYNSEYTYTAGLLHKVGILLLAQNFPDEYQKVLEEIKNEEMDLWELEREFIGVTHNEASQIVFEHWQFPKEVSSAARYYNDPGLVPQEGKEITYIVHIANFACLNQGIGVGIERFPVSFFDEAWDAIGLQVEDIPSILEEIHILSRKAKEILEAS